MPRRPSRWQGCSAVVRVSQTGTARRRLVGARACWARIRAKLQALVYKGIAHTFAFILNIYTPFRTFGPAMLKRTRGASIKCVFMLLVLVCLCLLVKALRIMAQNQQQQQHRLHTKSMQVLAVDNRALHDERYVVSDGQTQRFVPRMSVLQTQALKNTTLNATGMATPVVAAAVAGSETTYADRSSAAMKEAGLMCDCRINLFTTVIDNTRDPRKIAAQDATLDSLQRLRAHGVQSWLFTSSSVWAHKAAARQILPVRQFETNAQGTPMLSFMYAHVQTQTSSNKSNCTHTSRRSGMAFDAYLNGDIVFTAALIETLAAIEHHWSGRKRGVLLVGRRTNVNFHAADTLGSDAATVQMSKQGTIFQTDAQDYFIYSRGTRDWTKMPYFVVGRRAYDNWLVDNAFHDTETGERLARLSAHRCRLGTGGVCFSA